MYCARVAGGGAATAGHLVEESPPRARPLYREEKSNQPTMHHPPPPPQRANKRITSPYPAGACKDLDSYARGAAAPPRRGRRNCDRRDRPPDGPDGPGRRLDAQRGSPAAAPREPNSPKPGDGRGKEPPDHPGRDDQTAEEGAAKVAGRRGRAEPPQAGERGRKDDERQQPVGGIEEGAGNDLGTGPEIEHLTGGWGGGRCLLGGGEGETHGGGAGKRRQGGRVADKRGVREEDVARDKGREVRRRQGGNTGWNCGVAGRRTESTSAVI